MHKCVYILENIPIFYQLHNNYIYKYNKYKITLKNLHLIIQLINF